MGVLKKHTKVIELAETFKKYQMVQKKLFVGKAFLNLVLKTNENQLVEMKQLAKSLKVDRLTFKTAQLYEFENGNDLMPTKAKYSRYKKQASGKFVIKNAQPNKCWRLWSGAVINVHGEVLPCCFDKASEYSFGNMSKNSFYSCWHSKKASDFREKIHQNRKLFEICRNCTSK